MPESVEQLRARLRAEIAAIEHGDLHPRDTPDGSGPRSARAFRAEDASEADGRWDAFRAEADGCAEEARLSDPAAALRKIERLCLVRERASEELRRRLAREGFEPAAAEEALARALACGLVDDARYADVLVRSRLAQGRGRQGIASELEGLGIDAGAVEALAESDGDDAGEVARALEVLDRKPPRAKNRRDAAYRRLAQKGFGSSVASTAARLWCEAHPAEA